MSKERNSQAPAITEQTLLMYGGFEVAYKEMNDHLMVNITQMAKPFGKMPKDWLKTQQYSELRNVLSDRTNLPSADIQKVKKGGKNQGTWLHEDLALVFAQWLDAKFYLACNQALKKALNLRRAVPEAVNGVMPVVSEGRLWYHYLQALESLGLSTISGSVAARKNRYREQFKIIFNQNFITQELFNLLIAEKNLLERKKMLAYNQLSLVI